IPLPSLPTSLLAPPAEQRVHLGNHEGIRPRVTFRGHPSTNANAMLISTADPYHGAHYNFSRCNQVRPGGVAHPDPESFAERPLSVPDNRVRGSAICAFHRRGLCLGSQSVVLQARYYFGDY